MELSNRYAISHLPRIHFDSHILCKQILQGNSILSNMGAGIVLGMGSANER